MASALQTLMQNPPQMYAAMVLACVLPTYFWRALGVALGKRVDENSALFQWVKCVALATMAAVVVRLLMYPAGDLAQVTPILRYGAFGVGIAAMLLLKRSVEWGLIVGVGLVFVVKTLNIGL